MEYASIFEKIISNHLKLEIYDKVTQAGLQESAGSLYPLQNEINRLYTDTM